MSFHAVPANMCVYEDSRILCVLGDSLKILILAKLKLESTGSVFRNYWSRPGIPQLSLFLYQLKMGNVCVCTLNTCIFISKSYAFTICTNLLCI